MDLEERLFKAMRVVMDPAGVERMGVSKMRGLNHKELRCIRKAIMVDGPHQEVPLAVVLPYDMYLEIQQAFFEVLAWRS